MHKVNNDFFVVLITVADMARLTLKLSDIGPDWVYLSWDEGSDKCGDKPFFPVSNSTLHCNYTKDDDEGPLEEYFNTTDTNIFDLSTNVTYSCWVEVQSEASQSCRQHSPQVTFTPGTCIIVVLYSFNNNVVCVEVVV